MKEMPTMKMRTALVRNENGNLSVKRYDDYKSNQEFADDLKANGFKVLQIWASYKSDAEVDNWEYLNRK